MDRAIRYSFPGTGMWSPIRGDLSKIISRIALQASDLSRGCFIQRDGGNENAVIFSCPLGNRPKLVSFRLRSSGNLGRHHGISLHRCGIQNLGQGFQKRVEASLEAESLEENGICKDSVSWECTADTSASLYTENSQKLMTSIGAAIFFSILSVFSIHPALAASAISGTKAAARAGSSAAVAVGRKATSSLIRTELLSSAWTGLVAGCLHTLTGPDHLAALAPLSIGRSRMESAAVGALWGCGHDAGQVIFGIFFLLLKDRLHIELLRTWGARIVGLTLLVIGATGIKEALEVPASYVALDGIDHHVSMSESKQPLRSGKNNLGFGTFVTGIVHGLQPDALLMILPALALPSRLAGAAFLCMFLLGTIMAMGSYTAFIGSCSNALKKRVPRITEGLSWGSSLVAIALGVAVLCSELFGMSLF